jgi:hypothetical protein
MKILFSFFVRLFISFLAAKFALGLLGAASPDRLIALSLILVLNTYLFDLLDWYYDGAWRRTLTPRELSWLMARLSVMLNSVRRRETPADHPRDSSREPPPGNRPGG